jgi:uncharacterized phage protein gp47/JayE
MPGPYPLATLAPIIDASGITAPPFEDILASLQASYRAIYGSDVYLEADSQDGQWIAVQAQAFYELNQAVIAAYFSFSPATALGIGLANQVKINGLTKQLPSNSTADLLLVGQAGRVITNGRVADLLNNVWALPAIVTIPLSGQIIATATCQTIGAVQAEPNTITKIQTMMPGWQSATNPDAASPGLPVETDAQLRRRQALSVSMPAITPRESIMAAIAQLPGVGRLEVYQNDTDIRDANGIPGHSIAVVVEGGDAVAIADMIARKKNVGCGTYGDIQVVVYDGRGVPNTINFFNLEPIDIWVTVFIEPRLGYDDSTAPLIENAIIQYIDEMAIGQPVYATWLMSPANLSGDVAMASTGMDQISLDRLASTYIVRDITIGTDPNVMSHDDVAIPFTYSARCPPNGVTIVLQLPGLSYVPVR